MASDIATSETAATEGAELPWSTKLILAPTNRPTGASEEDEGEPVKLEQGNLFQLPDDYRPEEPPARESPLPAPRSPQPVSLGYEGSANSGVRKRKRETEQDSVRRKTQTRRDDDGDDDGKVETVSAPAKEDNRPTFDITQSTEWNEVDDQFEMKGVDGSKLRFINRSTRKHPKNHENCKGSQSRTRRPDCINAPGIDDWTPLLLEKCTCGGYLISSALRTVFLSFKMPINGQHKDRGRKLVSWILWTIYASEQRVWIRGCGPNTDNIDAPPIAKFFGRESMNQSVSAATALLLVLRLQSTGSSLLGFCWAIPPVVVTEMALYQRGSFISTELVVAALKQMSVSILDGSPTSIRFMADSCANIVESSFRNGSKKEARLKARLESLIKDAISSIQVSAENDGDRGLGRDVDMDGTGENGLKETELKMRRKAIKQVAVVFGLLVSGTFKWVLKVAQDKKRKKKKIVLGINVVTSLIGVAGHGTDIAGGLVGLMATEALDFFWVDPSKGLHLLVQNCITDWVYVPLALNSTLPEILDPAPGLNELDQEEKAVFKEWFELMLRACHLLS